ncbi:hypothetical protein F991_01462 [Acinetobacter sp. CIP-A165]|uniref:phage tail protein n=1 Tax=Acinetobacter sp. CIP-A165 TaxID=40373 RepID=UPI0002CE78A0|nr:phage tail protein [Acinetobacter sp. CIP-A165]ENU30664.1 hypothetical protein F991_01462 [Acinetobacter sp. CIP-A165]
MSYYTKITTAGLAAITAAMNNSSKVPITYMAFGDGNGYIPEPDENATSLLNEVYRVGVNKVEVHSKNPNWLVCEAIIPSAVGGFNIREVALYDSTGNTMLAIASYPPTYKPTVEEGAAKIQTIRIVIQVDNSGSFELIVDPDVVLATAQYVQDEVFKGQSNVSVKQYGAKGDGLHDDHLALQNNATAMDLDQLTYMFIPCRQESYLLKDTVVINMPSMIFGNRAATYYRGVGKKGYIIVDSEGPAFDLGGDKNTAERLGNPADQWTVKNIGFIPHPDQLPLTKVAIQHSAKTNGPDRGFILEEVSGSRLKNVLHIKDHGVQTQLATLVVEKCTISNNSIAILADGNVFGARIVGNQIEQNSSGCIHGVFHAALTIHDNMLEGSGNTIYIKDHNIDRNGCYLSLEGNYFELNYGDYLIKMDSYKNTIFSKGNYVSGFLSSDGITPNTDRNRPTDHFLLTNTYTMVYIYDALSVTFYGSASLLEKNNLDKYLLYVEPSKYFKEIGLYKDINRLENNSYLTKNIGNKVLTELGEIYVLGTSGTYINSKLLSSANDILEINASFFSNSDEDYIQYLTVIDTNNNRLPS